MDAPRVPTITVILCTYNRAPSLPKALTSVVCSGLSQQAPWEVLVVDNNSTDRTREAVEEFAARYPGRIRYLFEARPGKSNALNAGLERSQGEVVAFVDDDVVADSNWVASLTAPILDGKAVGAGGRILPEQGFVPPSWLPTTLTYGLAPLAGFDLGPRPGRLMQAPVGTNMAFRRELFEKYGGFRTDLGPRPGNEIRNEDTEFGNRVLAGGELLWYEPSAVVYHEVGERRLRKEYFLVWWFDKGRADIRQYGVRAGTRWFWGGVPLYLVRNLCVHSLRWAVSVGSGPRFARKIVVWNKLGEIAECRRQRSGHSHLSRVNA